jgi:Tol biopolymer transport system component
MEASRELPKAGIIFEMLTWCYLKTGEVAQAIQSAKNAVELTGRSSAALAALATAEAANGSPQRAAALRNEIESLAQTRYVSRYDRASAALAVSERQTCLEHLEQGIKDRDWWLSWVGVDPRWDAVRQENKFKRLLPLPSAARTHFALRQWLPVAIVLLLVIAAATWRLTRHTPIPFENTRITKLTSNGTAESAAISPDGKTVVYVGAGIGGSAIWQRDLQSGEVHELMSKITEKVTDLAFTNNGAALSFVTFPPKNPGSRKLFKVPVSGGAVKQIGEVFPGPVSVSADGKTLALYQMNPQMGKDELVLNRLEKAGRKVLASYVYPRRFAWTCRPAWSPKGNRIAYAAEESDKDGFLVRLYVIDVETGVKHPVMSPRWQWVQSINWTGDEKALAVVGQELDSSFQQIWWIPYPSARNGIRRVGNDLDDYSGATLNALGSEIISVQSQTLSNLYIAKPGDLTHPRQITTGSGRYFDLSWLRDGRILYASDGTGSADLWLMNADGTGQHPIIAGAGRNYAPSSSPSADAIAFHSNRSGNWQVWRADLDGSHVKQISPPTGDANWPQFSPDGQSVLFHRTGPNGAFHLWRASANGSNLVQITKALAMHPAVSRLDGRIAAWYSENVDDPHWKIAIFAPEGGEPLRVFNPTPDARPDTPIRWTSKGDAITFVDYAHAASNIWLQPINGQPARPLTFFDSGEIYSFDWSAEGALLYSRGLTTADVVLIHDSNGWKGGR